MCIAAVKDESKAYKCAVYHTEEHKYLFKNKDFELLSIHYDLYHL